MEVQERDLSRRQRTGFVGLRGFRARFACASPRCVIACHEGYCVTASRNASLVGYFVANPGRRDPMKPDDAALVWLLDADAIRVAPVDDAPPCIVRPAALLKEWIGLTARPEGRRHPDGSDPWEDVRHILLAIYPTFLGQN
jgi:hypothetical protein